MTRQSVFVNLHEETGRLRNHDLAFDRIVFSARTDPRDTPRVGIEVGPTPIGTHRDPSGPSGMSWSERGLNDVTIRQQISLLVTIPIMIPARVFCSFLVFRN